MRLYIEMPWVCLKRSLCQFHACECVHIEFIYNKVIRRNREGAFRWGNWENVCCHRFIKHTTLVEKRSEVLQNSIYWWFIVFTFCPTSSLSSFDEKGAQVLFMFVVRHKSNFVASKAELYFTQRFYIEYSPPCQRFLAPPDFISFYWFIMKNHMTEMWFCLCVRSCVILNTFLSAINRNVACSNEIHSKFVISSYRSC